MFLAGSLRLDFGILNSVNIQHFQYLYVHMSLQATGENTPPCGQWFELLRNLYNG